jgi:hypothetical protein
MKYDPASGAYTVTFTTMPRPAAQPSYQITSSTSGSTTTWNLVTDAPTFTGTISEPPPGAILPAGKGMCVSFSPQPADYVVVELFRAEDAGAWLSVYRSSPPKPSDVAAAAGSCADAGAAANVETIPGMLRDGGMSTPAGSYLLNVSFTKANCPTTADGCVHSSTVANELISVQ